jgi:hypothetical protein
VFFLQEHLLGSSVFSLGDVHSRLLPFIQWFRKQKSKTLFFVSVDVKSSFDSVNQKKLCDVLFEGDDAVLTSDRYVLQRFSVHLPCVGHLVTSFKVREIFFFFFFFFFFFLVDLFARSRVATSSFDAAQADAKLQHSQKLRHCRQQQLRVFGQVFFFFFFFFFLSFFLFLKVCCGGYCEASHYAKCDLYARKILFAGSGNSARLHFFFKKKEKKNFLFLLGSVLSSLLCSLFYGHMESKGELGFSFPPVFSFFFFSV